MKPKGLRIRSLSMMFGSIVAAVALMTLPACASSTTHPAAVTQAAKRSVEGFYPTAAQEAFLDTLEHRTFRWFWDLSDPSTGITPDRAPTRSFASVSATGFALTAYPIGVERGWVSRAAARERVLKTLRFFWTARQDTAGQGATGTRFAKRAAHGTR